MVCLIFPQMSISFRQLALDIPIRVRPQPPSYPWREPANGPAAERTDSRLALSSPARVGPGAQAQRLESVRKAAEILAKSYGKDDSNHSRLNDDLGKSDDPATQEFYKFLDPLVGQSGRAEGKRWVDRQ